MGKSLRPVPTIAAPPLIASSGIISGVAGARDNIYSNTIDSLTSTGGTGTIVSGINITAGTQKNIYQNTITNLWGNNITTGSVRGMLISGGTAINIYQNTISGISTTVATTGTTSGIWVTAGVTISISRNKIYDIACTGTAMSAAVYGIQVSGATANLNCTINNNIIGDLRAPAVSNNDAIRGIGVILTGTTSSTKVYYNTIYINASSTGSNFGTTGIYHTTNGTATTSSLDLRNNSITNISTPKGTGFSVAYRRSNTTLTNYVSASNNNMLYAGTASVSNLLFYDGSSSDQLITTFKTRVSPRETASITEDLITAGKFLSTVGTSTFFLHMDGNIATALRRGGAAIAGFDDDYDGDIRFGSTGYHFRSC